MARPKAPPPPLNQLDLNQKPKTGRAKSCGACEWWDPSKTVTQIDIGRPGNCHLNPETVAKNEDSWCSHWITKFK